MEAKTTWIGDHHGGYELKSQIAEHLAVKGIDVRDVGSDCDRIVRYPYYAAELAGDLSGTRNLPTE